MLKNRFAMLVALAVLLVAGSLTALAQQLLTQKALSADAAQAIARGALDRCRADGYHVSVTVIDDGNRLKAFVRDDGSGPHTIDFSRKKAYSALTFKSDLAANERSNFRVRGALTPAADQRRTRPPRRAASSSGGRTTRSRWSK